MSWVHVDSVDYLTKFTNQQFSRDHRTVMLSLPSAYIICILKTYIIYVILSVLYSHTHTLSISTLSISINTLRIFSVQTHYIIQRVHNCLCLGCCSTTPTSLSLDSNRNFQLLAAVTGRTVFFLWGRTGHSSPALGWYIQPLAPRSYAVVFFR